MLWDIDRLHEKFTNTVVSLDGLKMLVRNLLKLCNAQKTKQTYDDSDAPTLLALKSVAQNPKLYLRKRVKNLELSKSWLQKSFKETQLHLFMPKLLHKLEREHEGMSSEFCLWVEENYLEIDIFIELVFSPTTTFYKNRNVIPQNSCHRALENPNYVTNTKSQFYKKVNMWCGICLDGIVGPCFIEGKSSFILAHFGKFCIAIYQYIRSRNPK